MQNPHLKIIGSWELDLSSGELYWSDETKLIHGVELSYTPTLDSALEFYREDYRDKVKLIVDHLIELGDNYDNDCCLVRKDGEQIWVRITGLIIQKDHHGNPTKIGGTVQDITHYYSKVTKLEKYWGILNDSNMLSVSNKMGVIKFVNESFCKLTGYERGEVIGKTHRIFNSGYHSKEFFKELWDTINRGEKWEGEILNKNKDGRLQWIETIIFPVLDHKGELSEFISIRYDITEKKENQKKAVDAERLKVVGEVGTQILHELMTPLSLIHYHNEHLIKNLEEKGNQEGLAYAQKVKESARRVIEIFDDMRSLIKDRDDYEYVELAKIIKKSYFYTHIQMQKNEIDFVFDTQNSDQLVWGSSGQLGQVFTNLLNNSIQAIKDLEDKWIKVSIKNTDGYLVVQVMDSGDGIPSDMQEKIFESLFTTKGDSGGTGLGLAISRRLIERMGGQIDIDEACPNTCFTLKFPIKEESKKAS